MERGLSPKLFLMNTFCIEYVGEGDDFPVERIQAYTAEEARNAFLNKTGIDPFRITEIWQHGGRQRVEEWNGMD